MDTVTLGISGDYAVLKVGKVSFYYGYEFAYLTGLVDRGSYEDEDPDWGFAFNSGLHGWEGAISKRELIANGALEDENTEYYLLFGIGILLARKVLMVRDGDR